MKLSLVHKLFLGVWAFRPDAAEAYYPLVFEYLNNGGIATFSRREEPKTQTEQMEDVGVQFVTPEGQWIAARDAKKDLSPNTTGLVAVLPVHGAIMVDDWCEEPGTRTMSRWLNEFDNDNAISGVMLDMDTPGGSGMAMFQMSQALMNMKKPTLARTEYGMACSAGYGIGASCDLFHCGSAIDSIGSIGTYVSMSDYNAFWKSKGLPIHNIRATKSTDKNASYLEALKADPSNENDEHYQRIRQSVIDPFNERFLAHVRQQRPGIRENAGVLTGEVFRAETAISHGMIDAVDATAGESIAALRALAQTRNLN